MRGRDTHLANASLDVDPPKHAASSEGESAMSVARLSAVAMLSAGATFAPHAARADTLTTIYSFMGGSDGEFPNAVIYADGALYGTTEAGGASGNGTVFKVDPSTGAEIVLYSFIGGTDGEFPYGAMIYQAGSLYGTTYLGGPSDRKSTR